MFPLPDTYVLSVNSDSDTGAVQNYRITRTAYYGKSGYHIFSNQFFDDVSDLVAYYTSELSVRCTILPRLNEI